MNRITAIDGTIGRNVRALRALRALDQKDLAELMAASHPTWRHQQTVSEVERGRRGVLVSEALALAEHLGVGLHQLLSEQLIEKRPNQ